MTIFGYKLKRNELITLMILILLVIAIPSSVYLVQKTQIFKSRAEGNSAGKLGVQIRCNYPNQEEFEKLIAQRPAVIKLMDDFSCAGRIKQISSTTIVVGRIYEANQVVDDQPEARAQEWFDRNAGTLRTEGIDCWEGYNEPSNPENVEKLGLYGRLEKKRVELLADIGKQACIGNFSVQTPAVPQDDGGAAWSAFRPALEAVKQYGGYLALHEYGAPSLKCLFGQFNSNTGFLAGRYRNVYDNYLKPNNLEIPLIITETGVTGLICHFGCGCNSNQDEGWRNLGISPTAYADDLRWYNSLLEADGYVKGATIFISGHPDWPSFDPYPEIIGPQGLLISYGGSAPPPPGGTTGPDGSVITKCGTSKAWTSIDAELKVAGWGGPFDHSQNELNVFNGIVKCSGGVPPGSGSSCSIGYQSPAINDSCSACITGKDPGLVGAIKSLGKGADAPKFASCSNKELITFWCNNLSAQSMRDCIKLKKSCGASCAGDWVITDPACQDKCSNCVLQYRDDILPFFRQNGRDTDCKGFSKIIKDWCDSDPTGCKEAKEGQCRSSCVAGAAATPSPTPTPTPTPRSSPTPTPTPSPSPSAPSGLSAEEMKFDLNKDGKINSVDVELLFEAWRASRSGSFSPVFDLYPDSNINSIDYSVLISHF